MVLCDDCMFKALFGTSKTCVTKKNKLIEVKTAKAIR